MIVVDQCEELLVAVPKQIATVDVLLNVERHSGVHTYILKLYSYTCSHTISLTIKKYDYSKVINYFVTPYVWLKYMYYTHPWDIDFTDSNKISKD